MLTIPIGVGLMEIKSKIKVILRKCKLLNQK